MFDIHGTIYKYRRCSTDIPVLMHLASSMTNSSGLVLITALSPRSAIESIDPGEVPVWVKEIFIQQCFQVATLTMQVYDARGYYIDEILINTNIPSSHHL